MWVAFTMATITVISDTHGLLRAEARAHLAEGGRIIHAGDIDNEETLRQVAGLGPLTVVRGNCDRGPWAVRLPRIELLTVEGHVLCVVHNLAELDLDVGQAGVRAVVFGHSHVPCNERRDGVLYFNPGSAGPPRFGRPVTMGKLHLEAGKIHGEIIPLPTTRQAVASTRQPG